MLNSYKSGNIGNSVLGYTCLAGGHCGYYQVSSSLAATFFSMWESHQRLEILTEIGMFMFFVRHHTTSWF